MKAREENGRIKMYVQLPKTWKNHLNFSQADEELQKQEGFYDVENPQFNPDLQVLGPIFFDEENEVFTYPVVDKTQEQIEHEIESRLKALDSQIDFQSVKRLLQKVAEPVLADEENLTEQDIEDAKTLYKQYRVGVIYNKDSSNLDEKRFVWNGDLYKVIGTKHTSQADWKPDKAVSLYVKIRPPGVVVPWSLPESTNPYKFGDKVSHNGHLWESNVADAPDGKGQNVWEPGVYGWTDLGPI
jgi:hypothetical protein